MDQLATTRLPWFIERCSSDIWYFGILVEGGITIGISTINSITEDGQWIDVQLLDRNFDDGAFPMRILKASCEREAMSIKIDKIIGVFELCST